MTTQAATQFRRHLRQIHGLTKKQKTKKQKNKKQKQKQKQCFDRIINECGGPLSWPRRFVGALK
jgi:hypothetical protein